MYERFFHLTETPFSIAPNPHYLYMSKQHNEALAHLIYGVGRDGGFVLLTGEVGTGKTTVCRCFLEQVPEDTDVAFVLNPKLQVEELLATICDELSIPYIGDSISIKDYVDCINNFLLRQHSEGRHTVLIIDEAQNLNPDVLEQIRLLTNLETHEKKLLQIVLLGQPELQEMFRQPELRQLSQRVTARFHLNALTSDEVGPYVYHRLTIAGSIDPRSIFPVQSIHRLYQISKGVPRIINLICDRAMLGAYAKETRVIDSTLINNAAKEVLGYEIHSPAATSIIRSQWMPPVMGGIVGALMVALVMFAFLSPEQKQISTLDTTPEATDSAAPPPPLLSLPSSKPTDDAIIINTEQNTTDEPQTDKNSASIADAFNRSTHLKDADAYMDLFTAWGVDYHATKNGLACKYAESLGLSCLSKLGSLGSIKHYGLPVILRLFNDSGEERYIVVRHIIDNQADVYINGSTLRVSLDALDSFWRGHYSLLWKKPPSYYGPMHPGTIAPLSKWLSYQLDVWENKTSPSLGRASYDAELVERVKAFQRYVGEEDDGIVGTGTLIQLSRRVDESIPLLDTLQEGS